MAPVTFWITELVGTINSIHTTFFVCLIAVLTVHVLAEEMPAGRLHYDLFQRRFYEKLIRPKGNEGRLTVRLGMRLTQLLDVEEREQIMVTSVWILHEWEDPRLKWSPADYGGVTMLHIPSDDLWKPDIVLYNNADGDFAITLKTKATVYYDGRVRWEPPAIYKSYCPIDVEFFPFDIQECFMKFGVWTYDGLQVDLKHYCMKTDNSTKFSENEVVIPRGIDLKDFYSNVEWDVVNVTARRKVKFYPCCTEPYPDITFNVTIRRRTLFYTINLIIPCIAISCLTVLVFYLPADSGEKITLSLSILMALAVFFLLLNDIIPPTSLVISLIGKYLLFTMVVVTTSVILTVVTLSINLRSPATHVMSPWVRRVFIEILPRVLFMRRPDIDAKQKASVRTLDSMEERDLHNSQTWDRCNTSNSDRSDDGDGAGTYARLRRRMAYYPTGVEEAINGAVFISDHIKEEEDDENECRDWKYVAMVLDRLFLYIFTTACCTGSMSIFLHAPSLYDPRKALGSDDGFNQTCAETL